MIARDLVGRWWRTLLLTAPGLVLSIPAALGHPLNVGLADITIREAEVSVSLSINLFELDLLLSLDGNLDTRIEPGELEARRKQIVEYLTGRVVVSTDEGHLPQEAGAFHISRSADGRETFETTLRFGSSRALRRFAIRCEPLTDLGADHKTIARITRGGRSEPFVFQKDVLYEAREPTLLGSAGQFLWLGIHHIFVGYDHLAFLVGLVLTATTWLGVVKIVTSFTVAHSLTLSLAVLDVLSLPARLVEAGIAFSVAYVAMENLVVRSFARRWLVSLLFGFVHGFGFAGVLKEMPLSREMPAGPLLFFNLGVEMGQVAVISLLLPLLWLLAGTPAYPATVKSVSLVILGVGTVWFFQRML